MSPQVAIMVTKIAKALSAALLLVFFADVRPAWCDGWSLPNPFASSEPTPKPRPKKVAARTAKQEPSTLDKIGTGTKNLFNKTGETLGLKKPQPKTPQYAVARPPTIQPVKKEESKSWLGSMLGPEQPKKPKTVGEWMATGKRLDP
jgi:hypothetical protein